MGAETVATLVVTAIIVAALAVLVLAIGLQLRRLSFTLGTILMGLRAIRMQTAPLSAVFGDLVDDVDALEGVLAEMAAAATTGQSSPATAEPSVPAPAELSESPPFTPDESIEERVDRPVGTSLVRSSGPPRGRRAAPRRRRRTPTEMRADIARAGHETAGKPT